MNTFVEEHKVLTLLLLFALITPYAWVMADTGVSSGLDTILRSNTLEGEDTFRATIAGYLHRPISFIITVAGFMMIMFTFMKMALTLWYLSFPDFFDRIDAQQRAMLTGGLKGRKSPTDIITYFLGLIFPNVKLLTDYSGDNNNLEKEPLAYLKSQLPKIFLMIVLGAAIYDGQVRNIIAKAGDIALMFGNIINTHDTVGAVSDFIGVSEKYVFTYDTTSQEGKNREKIAEAIQKHLHALNPNIKSAEHGTAIGTVSETWTNQVVTAMESAAKTGGMGGIGTITSFKISVVGKTVPLASTDAGARAGKLQFTLNASDKNHGLILDRSTQKYVVIQFSELRDKDNRNWLWSNDVKTETKKP